MDIVMRVLILSLFLFTIFNLDRLLFDILNKNAPDARFGARPSETNWRPEREHIR